MSNMINSLQIYKQELGLRHRCREENPQKETLRLIEGGSRASMGPFEEHKWELELVFN